MGGLITIIVPIYNAETYMQRCVDSILDQTYKNLEIILVDDGSLDNSALICDEYVKQDNRVKVIHKKNGGAADARNSALDIAYGDYIGFVDSDDWIEPDMFEVLIEDAVANNADISCCGYYKVYNNGSKDNNIRGFSDYRVFKGKEIFKEFFLFTNFPVWNKIYKSHIFADIRFPVGKIYEDTRIMYKVLDAADVATWNPLSKYYYFQRDDSVMHAYKFENAIDEVSVLEELRIAVLSKFPELEKKIIWNKNSLIMDVCTDVYFNHSEYKKSKQLQALRKQIDLSIIFDKESSSSNRFRCLLVLLKFTPGLYKTVWKIKRLH